MHYDLTFWSSLSSLSLIVLYAILVFNNTNPLIAIVICVGGGFIFNHSSPFEMGKLFKIH